MQKHHHCPRVTRELSAKRRQFNNCVTIFFEDGSAATFHYAMAVREGPNMAVYTEHCGYHAFRYDCIDHWLQEPYPRKKTKERRKNVPTLRHHKR